MSAHTYPSAYEYDELPADDPHAHINLYSDPDTTMVTDASASLLSHQSPWDDPGSGDLSHILQPEGAGGAFVEPFDASDDPFLSLQTPEMLSQDTSGWEYPYGNQCTIGDLDETHSPLPMVFGATYDPYSFAELSKTQLSAPHDHCGLCFQPQAVTVERTFPLAYPDPSLPRGGEIMDPTAQSKGSFHNWHHDNSYPAHIHQTHEHGQYSHNRTGVASRSSRYVNSDITDNSANVAQTEGCEAQWTGRSSGLCPPKMDGTTQSDDTRHHSAAPDEASGRDGRDYKFLAYVPRHQRKKRWNERKERRDDDDSGRKFEYMQGS